MHRKKLKNNVTNAGINLVQGRNEVQLRKYHLPNPTLITRYFTLLFHLIKLDENITQFFQFEFSICFYMFETPIAKKNYYYAVYLDF